MDSISSAAVLDFLHSRPRAARWRDSLRGRRYLATRFGDRLRPLVVIAHSFRDAAAARQLSLAVEQDWLEVPQSGREAYDEILFQAPGLVVVQLRRTNVCGCLGHRHPYVREAPFAETHDVFRGTGVGEMDIAYKRVVPWHALPLSDAALDARFLEGSRLEEFRKKQLRLKLLSIILHETHHFVSPHEPENVIRELSVSFYREALADYVENTAATLSLTIDRSFSRLG